MTLAQGWHTENEKGTLFVCNYAQMHLQICLHACIDMHARRHAHRVHLGHLGQHGYSARGQGGGPGDGGSDESALRQLGRSPHAP